MKKTKDNFKKIHINKLTKFLLLVVLIVIYTVFCISKYGMHDGPLVSLLTWSFFVFCTPIADAGFLIDFPVRVLTGLKMLYTELIVWTVALIITIYAVCFSPQVFETSVLLQLYHLILTNIFPYGIIIVLSCIGTFFSVYFGDELFKASVDKLHHEKYVKHKWKHEVVILLSIIMLILVIYAYLLKTFNIDIPLI